MGKPQGSFIYGGGLNQPWHGYTLSRGQPEHHRTQDSRATEGRRPRHSLTRRWSSSILLPRCMLSERLPCCRHMASSQQPLGSASLEALRTEVFFFLFGPGAPMTHYLLTGASGLLGSHLLRDCLRAGHHMAVLVRPTETQSARERVDASLAHWAEQTGRVLPQPLVFEGDLSRPDLNLTASDSIGSPITATRSSTVPRV